MAFAMLKTMPSILLSFVILFLAAAAGGADDEVVRHNTRTGFEQAKENLVLAIEGRGLVINNVSHVGDMLERTGRDLGGAAQLYGKAEVVEFCSARVSRDMMSADPHNIVYCPYSIAVYTLPGEAGQAYIAYRRPPLAKQGMPAVEKLLADIVKEALK